MTIEFQDGVLDDHNLVDMSSYLKVNQLTQFVNGTVKETKVKHEVVVLEEGYENVIVFRLYFKNALDIDRDGKTDKVMV